MRRQQRERAGGADAPPARGEREGGREGGREGRIGGRDGGEGGRACTVRK